MKRKPLKYVVTKKYSTIKEVLSDLYEVRPDGRIFRKCDGRELKSVYDKKGYKGLRLVLPQFATNKDGRHYFKIHRLVAMFYLSNYCETMQVNHKNGIKDDNRVENLEMVTNQENVLHAYRILDSSTRRKKLAERMKYRDAVSILVVDLKTNKVIKRYKSICDAAKDYETTKCAMHRRVNRGRQLQQR